jgi:diguanylate cyclase (GGDEF)-like protein
MRPHIARENRFFPRHPVSLPATCSTPGNASLAVEIRDFCLSGLLLAYAPESTSDLTPAANPLRGELIEIHCTVPTTAGERRLSFRGTVVRSDDRSAGIEFLAPESASLELLHTFARTHPHAGPRPPARANISGAAGAGELNTEQVLVSCKRIAEGRLDSLVAAFLAQLHERLFAAADEAKGGAERNTWLHAMNTFDKNQPVIGPAFTAAMQRLLSSFPAPIERTAGARPRLSLVEKQDFEHWLEFTDIARKVEAMYKFELADLEQRLSAVAAVPVDSANNPLGGNAFSHGFAEALHGILLDPTALHTGCAVFADVLCVHVGELYGDLNRHLVAAGVLPELSEWREYKPVNRSFPRRGVPAAAAPAGEIGLAGTASPAAGPTRDWFAVVQELQAMQHQVARAKSSADAGRAPPDPAPAGPGTTPRVTSSAYEHCTTEELLRALSRVRLLGLPSGQFLTDLTRELRAVLREDLGGDTRNQPSPREARIIETFGSLLDALLADRLIAENVKPWLKELAIPLLKLALVDDSLLVDPAHLARQLINQVVQFELYADAGPAGSTAVGERIGVMLHELAATERLTPEAIDNALKEMQLVLKVQEKIFQENLHTVRGECEDAPAAQPEAADPEPPVKAGFIAPAAQPVVAGSAVATPPAPAVEESQDATPAPQPDAGEATQPTALAAPAAALDESIAKWEDCLARLKPGARLLLDLDSSTPQRVQLAWMDEQREHYVFVNVKGLRQASLTRRELVRELAAGVAVVLDAGDEPALDRAQYAMLQSMHQRLLHEMAREPVTGLINRREFLRLLSELIADARCSTRRHVVCLLALYQSSTLDLSLTQEARNRMLTEMSDLMRQEVGDRATVARVSGNEFAILFEQTTAGYAASMVRRVKAAIEAYRHTGEDGSVSVSLATALAAVKHDCPDIESLMDSLQKACSAAREEGPDRIRLCRLDEAANARTAKMMAWVSTIDEALASDTLELRCQWVVALSAPGMPVHHSSILLGVPDENGILRSPSDLISAAEYLQRLPAIDRWVVRQVFEWMDQHSDKLAGMGERLAIKVSRPSLASDGFARFVLDEASRHGTPLERICFEVTETAGLSNLSRAADFILQMKDAGCTFALAHFGTGDSSYAYLKSLPVDFLKIDGNFVRRVDQDDCDLAVVKSVTEIGHFMGKKIIAEHVESRAVLDILRQIGVDYAQGNALDAPRSLREVENRALFLLRQLRSV